MYTQLKPLVAIVTQPLLPSEGCLYTTQALDPCPGTRGPSRSPREKNRGASVRQGQLDIFLITSNHLAIAASCAHHTLHTTHT